MSNFNKSLLLSITTGFFLLFTTVLFAADKIFCADNDEDVRTFAEAVLSGTIAPNQTMDDGTTALMVYAAAGNLEAVDKLLKMGAKPNTINNHGLTAIMGLLQSEFWELIFTPMSSP